MLNDLLGIIWYALKIGFRFLIVALIVWIIVFIVMSVLGFLV